MDFWDRFLTLVKVVFSWYEASRDTPKDTPARLPTLRVATTTRHANVLDFFVAVRQLENVPEEVPAVVAQASFWIAL
jgi:hypothetical protein